MSDDVLCVVMCVSGHGSVCEVINHIIFIKKMTSIFFSKT